jgi:hypothetical protein
MKCQQFPDLSSRALVDRWVVPAWAWAGWLINWLDGLEFFPTLRMQLMARPSLRMTMATTMTMTLLANCAFRSGGTNSRVVWHVAECDFGYPGQHEELVLRLWCSVEAVDEGVRSFYRLGFLFCYASLLYYNIVSSLNLQSCCRFRHRQ